MVHSDEGQVTRTVRKTAGTPAEMQASLPFEGYPVVVMLNSCYQTVMYDLLTQAEKNAMLRKPEVKR